MDPRTIIGLARDLGIEVEEAAEIEAMATGEISEENTLRAIFKVLDNYVSHDALGTILAEVLSPDEQRGLCTKLFETRSGI